MVRNGTASFSFGYAWKDAAGVTGSSATYRVSFDQALPVTIVGFSGEKRNGTAALAWTAVNEQSFRGYGVERSSDGRNFTEAGFVNGRGSGGTQEYTYNDDLSALSGPYVYYRLRLVDVSGTFSYSSVLRLALSGRQPVGVQVMGNPVRTSALRLQLITDVATTALVQVSDAAGHVIATRSQSIGAGSTQLQVELPAGLAKGAYTVHTVLGDEAFSSQVLLDR
ncbi:MAG: hypothetical protein EOO11_22685 [Chitinophagaceae bacterium]|nr:MAG: hypothetical protein EOO11_22685 [Chitinophagaceae bacterium]